ncbi:BOS complex subunit TMEM147 isoform X2 [Patagioenas fasciata]|uniref:BOS complex subunit TMEM147 isoform X2 n=1 Tax=Patagioenas fasciata TaxID=372321 RepID=UPI003A9A44EF
MPRGDPGVRARGRGLAADWPPSPPRCALGVVVPETASSASGHPHNHTDAWVPPDLLGPSRSPGSPPHSWVPWGTPGSPGRLGPCAMTLFHFGNCFALAYFPYFITYKCSGLSEYSAFWRCVQAGATYVLVQLGKEFLRASLDVLDLLGLQVALWRGAGRGELRILVAALGWAGAELVSSRCVPLWVGARGVEFDWRHLQMGLDSNISLARHVAAAALLWAGGRPELPPSLRLPLAAMLGAAAYEGFLIGWAGQALGLGPWGALGLRALGAAALGLGALRVLVPLLPPPKQ